MASLRASESRERFWPGLAGIAPALVLWFASVYGLPIAALQRQPGPVEVEVARESPKVLPGKRGCAGVARPAGRLRNAREVFHDEHVAR